METQQLINEVAELEYQLDIAQIALQYLIEIAILGLEPKVQPYHIQ